MFIYRNKPILKVGLVGLGKSNLGVIEFLLNRKIEFDLTLRSDKEIPLEIEADRIFIGADAYRDIDEDILFLSPSVRRDHPRIADGIKRGVCISSDTELFFSLAKERIFAITGSDGKSTTTHLIADMLTASGTKAVPAGNYGKSLLSVMGRYDAVSAELSSFQLMYCLPSSYRAIITNITPNHLNWHKSLDEYIGAKLNVIKHTDGYVADFDSELLSPILHTEMPFALISLAFGYRELKALVRAENYLTFANDTVYLNGEPYFSTDGALRREPYNLRNFMIAAGATLGIATKENIESSIANFSGLPHRAEIVTTHGGVTYINSSIDSSPERTLKTLRALKGRVAVIICGKGKNLSLTALAEELPTLTVGAVLMGDIGEELAALLNSEYTTIKEKSMERAVAAATELLKGSGTVILSPAATSFDKYENFEERGRDFSAAVLGSIKN